MIGVEEEGVSFIFSTHSYSPDTCGTTGRKYQQLETLNPPWGWEHLRPHQRWMMLFGLGSISFTGQSSFQHPSTLSWKEALNISLQLLITCNELPWKCVWFFYPPTHTHSVVISSYSCGIVQCGDGNTAAANAHPLPVAASFSDTAAVQPGGEDYICLCRQIL